MTSPDNRALIARLREDAEHPAYRNRPIAITWRAAAAVLAASETRRLAETERADAREAEMEQHALRSAEATEQLQQTQAQLERAACLLQQIDVYPRGPTFVRVVENFLASLQDNKEKEQ